MEKLNKLLRSSNPEDLLIGLNILSTMTEEDIKSILPHNNEERFHIYPNIWGREYYTLISVDSIYILLGSDSLVWVDDPTGWNYKNIIK